MPRYIYVAKTAPDKTSQGYIEADSEQDAINRLTQMGYFPLSVRSESSLLEKRSFLIKRRISFRDIVLFTRQLSSLLESGVNILNAINIVAQQASNFGLRVVLDDIANRIKDGSSFSESLAGFPELFPEFYRALVHSGEVSGEMAAVLRRLSDFLEEEEDFRSSLKASLTYPAFIFLVSVITIIILLVFVIPRLVNIFEDMGQLLPLSTRILIEVSSLVKNYWYIILAAGFLTVFFIRRFLRTSFGKIYWDSLLLNLAFVREIVLKSQLSRMSRTMSLLLSSGVPITTALDITASILENQILRSEVLRFKEEISAGASLSSCLRNSNFFPPFMTSIVAVGEETGALDKSLLRVAVDYENQVRRVLNGLARLVEPLIILFMGLVVGFIVISMLLPIFQINLMVK